MSRKIMATGAGSRAPAHAVVLAVLCAASACATATGTVARAPASVAAPGLGIDPSALVATSYDTTYYVTNRARRNGLSTRTRTDSLEYGLVITRISEPAGANADGPYLASIDEQIVDSARLDRDAFLARLRTEDSVAARRGEGTVVYVHGYATSFGRAIAQGAEIAHRGSFRGPFVVFAWPAHTALATWPSRYAMVSRAYRQDSVSASESMGAFRTAIAEIRSAVCGPAMTVVGHSLGAQLTAEALAEPSPIHDSFEAEPMRALVLFAPDISVARYRDTLAAVLAPIATRQVVYASSADWMLGISRLVNHSTRMGRAGPARTLAPEGIEVIDVTRGRRVDGMIRKLFEPQHAMRLASSALYDFFGVVRGLPADCRTAAGVADREPDGTWQLTKAAIPRAEPAPAAACAER